MNGVAIGLGVLGLILLTSGRGTATSIPVPPATPLPLPDDSTIAGDSFVDQPDWWLDVGRQFELCHVPERRQDAWSDETTACLGKWRTDRANLFVTQVMAAAERIPVSSLTPAYLAETLKWLGGQADRSHVPLTYQQSKRIEDFSSSIGWVIPFVQTIETVGNLFTFGLLGALDKGVTKIVNATDADSPGGSDIASTTQALIDNYNASVTKARSLLGAATKDLAIQRRPPELSVDPLHSQFNDATVASSRIEPSGPSMEFGFDPITYPDGRKFFVRMGLLRTDPQSETWMYGWICAEHGYATGDVNDKTAKPERIAKIAKRWRALDVLGAMFYPDRIAVVTGNNADPNADSVGVNQLAIHYTVSPGLYAYRVGGIELWGCTLRAHPDDRAVDLADLGRFEQQSTFVGPIPKVPPSTLASGAAPSVLGVPQDPPAALPPVLAQAVSVAAPPFTPLPARALVKGRRGA